MSLFLLQLRCELLKLFAKKRTYLGYGSFLSVETLVLILWQLPKGQRTMREWIEHNGGAFDQYFSGLTLALTMVTATIFLLGALFLGLVGGDLVAKEIEDGTMRMTLCRPISRLRLLIVKYCACVIYTFSLVLFAGFSALAAAMIVRGSGGMFVMIPEAKLLALYDFQPGLIRYIAAIVCLAAGMLTISTFSFQLSCWNVKPAAATIAAIFVFLADWIFHLLPLFESYHPYLMSTHIGTWLNVLRPVIPWEQILEDYAILFGLNATFLTIGIVAFQARDLKS